MTISAGKPALFVIASVLLAMGCVAVTAAGTEMLWTGSFTFIPVLYLACVTANDANGRNLAQLGLLGLNTLPYLLCAALPVILHAIISYRANRCVDRSNSHGWLAVRQVSETPSPGYFEGIIAAGLAVGVAASLVEWHHVHYAQWLVWSAASVVTGDVATARAKWKDRMMGAMVGVPAGMLVGILMPHAALLPDVLTAAIVLTLVAFNQYVVAFGTRCALHAVAIIVAGHAIFSADDRAIDVAIGSIIGIVFVLGTNLIARSLKGPAASSRR
ncbi:FUSC family protein [Paraburkholderia sp. BL6669N2]|uniref:FUSC family protein n=1 Tax=Paraburkholderia sp. BL6669N2 TaxID=1938807 RepID=UPI0011C029D7|nr:FUSC family protein [Paraburkholderia sp. BL6669N2]